MQVLCRLQSYAVASLAFMLLKLVAHPLLGAGFIRVSNAVPCRVVLQSMDCAAVLHHPARNCIAYRCKTSTE